MFSTIGRREEEEESRCRNINYFRRRQFEVVTSLLMILYFTTVCPGQDKHSKGADKGKEQCRAGGNRNRGRGDRRGEEHQGSGRDHDT